MNSLTTDGKVIVEMLKITESVLKDLGLPGATIKTKPLYANLPNDGIRPVYCVSVPDNSDHKTVIPRIAQYFTDLIAISYHTDRCPVALELDIGTERIVYLNQLDVSCVHIGDTVTVCSIVSLLGSSVPLNANECIERLESPNHNDKLLKILYQAYVKEKHSFELTRAMNIGGYQDSFITEAVFTQCTID
jgi:hypothetical protein